MNRWAGLFQACAIILRYCFYSIRSPDAAIVASFNLYRMGKAIRKRKRMRKIRELITMYMRTNGDES
jgi:hypothetical protein